MSRTGQCPRCHAISPFHDDDVGTVFTCQCAQALFVADSVGFEEITVYCQQCNGEYVVDGAGAGEAIQCECGNQFVVPDLVLTEPVAQRGEIQGRVLNKHQSKADLPAFHIDATSQPESDAANERELERPKQQNLDQPNPDQNQQNPDQPNPDYQSHANTNPSNRRSPAGRKRKWSLGTLLGIGLVALLLLISLSVYVVRGRGLTNLANDGAAPSPPAPIRDITEAPASTVDPTDVFSTAKDFPEFDAKANALPSMKAASKTAVTKPFPVKSSPSFPPPPEKPLPAPQPARPIVAIPITPMTGYTFDRSYRDAFTSFTELNELEQKSGGTDGADYQAKLGETIAMLQASRSKIGPAQTKQQADEIRQLLTFLYFRAGRLPEAAILAEAALRWGDPKKDATKETALIGLAAMQEANQVQWANANQTGELTQMKNIIHLFAQRWPDDPRLSKMQMSLAQAFDRFGEHQQAAEAYNSVSADAKLYGQAQLAAGDANWVEYRKQASQLKQANSQTLQRLKPIRDQASNHLSQGINALTEANKGLSPAVMSAKLNLARIELTAGNPAAAEKWLTKGKLPLSRSIGLKTRKKIVAMPDEFIRVVYETLFSIQFERNDLAAAKVTLERMSKTLGKKHADQVSKLHLSIVTKYARQLTQLSSVDRSQLSTLANLIDPLKANQESLTVQNLLWLGESWASLAPKATDETSSKQCHFKAAAAYQLAMERDDFPKDSTNAAIVRRLELLRQAGRTSEALAAMTALLQQSPNAFAMQIQAAQATQDLAGSSGDSRLYATALEGADDSAIWGWNKLVTVLQSQSSSDQTNDRDIERLMQCRCNMLLCRFEIANAIEDQKVRADRLAQLKPIAKRLRTTMKPGVEPWFSRFEALLKSLDYHF
ncbi:tetratricopeptide repeat protein [Planctomycetes bacterium K23_9]|uniref:Tetratricopeptide repeat protein n=1 Tax=Stieleria marina TaxID=1930275 RepID=A0A517NRG1_9BACT|nr:hypothetical protein K239x_16780 [Planctomycetes bacterium K23_9]